MKPSKSPERHTFQKQGYLKRCEEKGEEPNQDYLDMFLDTLKREDAKWDDPKSRKNNMEWDLVTTDWILEKVRGDDVYAQHLYAAMCNNDFQKLDTMPILKNETWSCSWRYAGGIVADMQQKGDYINWYCSGIKDRGYDDVDLSHLTQEQIESQKKLDAYVGEGCITEEIRADLQRLGWVPVPGGDWEKM